MKPDIKICSLFCILFLFAGCFDDLKVSLDKNMAIETISVGDETAHSFVAEVEIIDEGEGFLEAGFCYSKNDNPPLRITSQTSTLNDSDELKITGLQSATTYLVRAYMWDGSTTVYGNTLEITTDEPNIFQANTQKISLISDNQIDAIGYVDVTSGRVIAYGHQWSMDMDFSGLENAENITRFENEVTSDTVYSSRINIENPYEKYYIRAYATDGYKIEYGVTKPITPNQRDYIKVVKPDESTVWEVGQEVEISWEKSFSSGVNLELYRGLEFKYEIDSNVGPENDYSFSITAGSAFASGDNYRLKIINADNPDTYVFSEQFSIIK